MAAVVRFLVCLAAACALGGCQRQLIFEPERGPHAKASDFAFPITDVYIRAGGVWPFRQNIHGWWIPPAGTARKVILYLHGNDGNLGTSVGEVAPLRALGYAVLLIDYRGYGESDGGFPSEAAVYEDAGSAWAYLVDQRRLRPADIVIYGHSLGGAIAIDLAARHPEAAGLVVESSFTSILDMAMLNRFFARLPVKAFLDQRFDSLGKVPGLALPVLYLHGTADEIVPFEMGERLFRASGGRKSFVAIPGGRHDHDAVTGEAILRSAIAAFMATSARR